MISSDLIQAMWHTKLWDNFSERQCMTTGCGSGTKIDQPFWLGTNRASAVQPEILLQVTLIFSWNCSAS